jgi:hypothetical protein
MADLGAAKRRVLSAIGDEPWCVGVGVGLVGDKKEKGLVVSVGKGAPANAGQRIQSLASGVPIQVRVLGNVRKLGG